MSSAKLPYSSLRDKKRLIFEGSLDLAQNVDFFLDKIASHKHLNAFIAVSSDCQNQANLIQEKIKNGNAGKLAGAVIAIKDVLSIKNINLTCASKILGDFIPLYTATAVQKLIDEDAIIIGKTNCDEFAMGSSNENSAFGSVLNPLNTEFVPGGSSGGSAAAVAAGLCDVSLGTDTGGSIRQPAAFCGIYGLKPTYSSVSRYGLTAFASSFDSIGPFATNLQDLFDVFNIIKGDDHKDSTSTSITPVNTELDPKKIKIGIPEDIISNGIQSEIRESFENFAVILEKSGVEIVKISLPNFKYAIAAYYVLTTAEASSNLSRFDGARYGFRSKDVDNLNEMYVKSRSEGFGAEVKRRIMLGTYVLSAGYYDAYYTKAQKIRRLIQQDFINCFKEVDFILTPTTPTTAFKIGEKIENPVEMYLSDIFTTPQNLAGLPALSFPYRTDHNKLPIGLQLTSNHFEESKINSFLNSLNN